jgi:hypothetical protein
VNLLKKVMVIEIVVVEERRRTSPRIIIWLEYNNLLLIEKMFRLLLPSFGNKTTTYLWVVQEAQWMPPIILLNVHIHIWISTQGLDVIWKLMHPFVQ